MPGTVITSLALCLTAICQFALAQELSRPVARDRILAIPVEQAWNRMLWLTVQSDAIVNTVDSATRLISFTIPIRTEEVSRYSLEWESLPKQPQIGQILMWARPVAQTKTRLFVRAVIGSTGIPIHSNGTLEDNVFEAIESGNPWRVTKPAEMTFDYPPERVWRGVLGVIRDSNLTLNAADAEARLLTCTIDIASDTVKHFTEAKGYHPAVAHMTLWFEPHEAGTRIKARTLLVEAGAHAPPPLPSNGTLETQIYATFTRRLAGESAILKLGTKYLGDKDFWWVLFKSQTLEADSIKQTGLKRQLPTSLDEAWTATLALISQFAVISHCDHQARLIVYVAAHPIKSAGKLSVHQMAVLLEATEFGVNTYASAKDAVDTPDELAAEESELIEKIATQLFLKEKLKRLFKS